MIAADKTTTNIQSNTKKKNLIIVGIILILAIAVLVLSSINRASRSNLHEGCLKITSDSKTVADFTNDDLRNLPSVAKEMVVNTSKGNEKHNYKGVSLLAVLQKADPDIADKYSNIVAKGMDGYTSTVSMDELLIPDNVYLMYEDNGAPMKALDGKAGSIQLVICSDEFGQRFTKYLVDLELQ